MKELFSFVWEISKVIIIALLIVVPVRYFIFQPFLVRGESMEPNFNNGDYLIVDEISYRFRQPQRGEVVVFKFPDNPSQRYIKRIIGLPEETVEIRTGQIFVLSGDEELQLDESSYLGLSDTPGSTKVNLIEDEYFVLGDNRPRSADSRRWGALPKENIIGRALFRAWPLEDLAKFETPDY